MGLISRVSSRTYRSRTTFQKWPIKLKPFEFLLSETNPKRISPLNSVNYDKSSPPSKSPRSPTKVLPNSEKSTSSEKTSPKSGLSSTRPKKLNFKSSTEAKKSNQST